MRPGPFLLAGAGAVAAAGLLADFAGASGTLAVDALHFGAGVGVSFFFDALLARMAFSLVPALCMRPPSQPSSYRDISRVRPFSFSAQHTRPRRSFSSPTPYAKPLAILPCWKEGCSAAR